MSVKKAQIRLLVNNVEKQFAVSLSFKGNDSSCLLLEPATHPIELDTEIITSEARRYSDYLELCCSMELLWTDVEKDFKAFFAFLQLPSGTVMYLGPLNREGQAVPSGRLVRHVPSSVTLVIQQDACLTLTEEPPWPVDMLLKEDVKTILLTEEFRSSIDITSLENIVKGTPHYEEVMARGRWKKWKHYIRFFSQCYKTWSVIAANRADPYSGTKKDRVVHPRYEKHVELFDNAREKLRNSYRLGLRQFVLDNPESAAGALSPSMLEKALALPFFSMNTLSLNRVFRSIEMGSVRHFGLSRADKNSRCCILYSALHPFQVDFDIEATPSLLFRSSGSTPGTPNA